MHKTKAFGLYACTLCDHMFGNFYLVIGHVVVYKGCTFHEALTI